MTARIENLDALLKIEAMRLHYGCESISKEEFERIRPYANVAVLAGHSCIRTAVMGEEASSQKSPTPAQLEAIQPGSTAPDAFLAEARFRRQAEAGSDTLSTNHRETLALLRDQLFGDVPLKEWATSVAAFERLASHFGFGETPRERGAVVAELVFEIAPGGFKLSGTKNWISNSPFADVFAASFDEELTSTARVRRDVLERLLPGLTIDLADVFAS